MSPVFPIKTLFLLVIPVAIAAIILAAAGRRGAGSYQSGDGLQPGFLGKGASRDTSDPPDW